MALNEQSTAPETIAAEIELVSGVSSVHAEAIKFLDNGWDSRVYEVNDGGYYFKFPRSAKIQSRYAGEVALAKLAGSIQDITVPEVVWQDADYAYIGYSGVPGKLLNDCLAGLSMEQKQTIGVRLGNFLRGLHSMDLSGARDVSLQDEADQLQRWSGPAIGAIRHTYGNEQAKVLESLVMHGWPGELAALGRKGALCHGDFHGGNILLANDGKIGIIDFGDGGYYDESKDFIGLSDATIFEAALTTYGDAPELRQKIALRRKIFQVIKVTAEYSKHGLGHASESVANLREIIALSV